MDAVDLRTGQRVAAPREPGGRGLRHPITIEHPPAAPVRPENGEETGVMAFTGWSVHWANGIVEAVLRFGAP